MQSKELLWDFEEKLVFRPRAHKDKRKSQNGRTIFIKWRRVTSNKKNICRELERGDSDKNMQGISQMVTWNLNERRRKKRKQNIVRDSSVGNVDEKKVTIEKVHK